jgi:hypothetical protein
LSQRESTGQLEVIALPGLCLSASLFIRISIDQIYHGHKWHIPVKPVKESERNSAAIEAFRSKLGQTQAGMALGASLRTYYR